LQSNKWRIANKRFDGWIGHGVDCKAGDTFNYPIKSKTEVRLLSTDGESNLFILS
jgi:hypothetical protein